MVPAAAAALNKWPSGIWYGFDAPYVADFRTYWERRRPAAPTLALVDGNNREHNYDIYGDLWCNEQANKDIAACSVNSGRSWRVSSTKKRCKQTCVGTLQHESKVVGRAHHFIATSSLHSGHRSHSSLEDSTRHTSCISPIITMLYKK